MLEEERLAPPAPKPIAFDAMSIEELEARVAALKQEIAACEQAMAGKRSARDAADAVFKAASS